MFLSPLPDEFIRRRKSCDERFFETVCTHCGKTIASSPCGNCEIYLLAAEVAHVCAPRIAARGVQAAA